MPGVSFEDGTEDLSQPLSLEPATARDVVSQSPTRRPQTAPTSPGQREEEPESLMSPRSRLIRRHPRFKHARVPTQPLTTLFPNCRASTGSRITKKPMPPSSRWQVAKEYFAPSNASSRPFIRKNNVLDKERIVPAGAPPNPKRLSVFRFGLRRIAPSPHRLQLARREHCDFGRGDAFFAGSVESGTGPFLRERERERFPHPQPYPLVLPWCPLGRDP